MTSHVITGDTIVVAVEDLASADLHGEVIVLDVNTGYYYGLNEVGASIMNLIKKPMSVTTIRDTLLQEYEVEAKELEHDVLSFLKMMEDRQLIRVMNGAAT